MQICIFKLSIEFSWFSFFGGGGRRSNWSLFMILLIIWLLQCRLEVGYYTNPLKILNKVAPSKPSHKHNWFDWNSTFKLSSSYIQTSKNSLKYFSCYECFLYIITQLLFVMHIRQTSFWLPSVFFFFFLWQIFLPCQSVLKTGIFLGKRIYVFEGFFMSLFNSFFKYKKHLILIYIVRNIEGCLIKI